MYPSARWGRAVPRSTSIAQDSRAAGGSARTSGGSTTCSATTVPVTPKGRFGVSRSSVTSRTSPGSAPSTKNGPVWGLPRAVTSSPVWSRPSASTVVVAIVSPLATRSTGSWEPIVVW
jgi:hypothetical protein